MPTPNFNLRNIAPEVMAMLKKEASRQNLSVNSLILQSIDHHLGVSQKAKKAKYHDLDCLAGTWSDREKKAFDNNTRAFETIDEELWQ